MASHKRCTSKSVEWYVGTRSHFTLVRRRKVIIAYWGVREGNDDDGEEEAAVLVVGGGMMAVGWRTSWSWSVDNRRRLMQDAVSRHIFLFPPKISWFPPY
jgi:hypothetical protein